MGGGSGLLAELKADPGRLGLETLLSEIAKLERVRALGLPDHLFADVPEKRVLAWRARAGAEYPAWMRAHPPAVRVTLLAALCACRLTEITDGLVELFLGVVHRVNARAENRVEGELIADLKLVRGKQGILFTLEGALAAALRRVRRSTCYRSSCPSSDRSGGSSSSASTTSSSSTRPRCASGPPNPSRYCAASPAAGPSTRPTRHSRSSAARSGRRSCATTSRGPNYVGRSMVGVEVPGCDQQLEVVVDCSDLLLDDTGVLA